ncbi:MAG: hypothetical protein V4450_17490 [Bacteroidota bacterium]
MPVPPKEKLPERVFAAFYANDTYIKMIDAQCEKVLPILASHPVTITNTFLTCMVERLHAGILSIDPLFSHYLKEPRIQFSLGILIRALHLDYLIMLNVLEIMKRNDNNTQSLLKEAEHFCHIMLSDSARHTLNLFKTNNIPPKVRKQLYIDLVRRHSECFKPYANDGSVPVLLLDQSYSPNRLVKKLRESSMPRLANKDHHYQFYSKYDHFGKLFHTISKNEFTWEFVHLGEAIRELPRSFGIMLTLALISTGGDPAIIEVATVVNKHCEAMDAQEKKEKIESVL